MQVETIRITGIGDGYDVSVADGLLHTIGDVARSACPSAKSAVVVTNDAVGPLYLPSVEKSMQSAGFEPIVVVLPDGERHKTTEALQAVYDAVLPRHIERSTPLIGLGGGVMTDLAGFAAATLLRGLPYVAVPTSLLAMVDASVGGKTGVNHAAGKNLVGAFYPASAVVIDPTTLRTLPDRELRGGLAECFKHDIIRDAEHLAIMEAEAASYRSGDIGTLGRLVAHNVRIKAGVVAADPFEQGERAHLNLGHTFGHAFEKTTDYTMSHGEAVGVGVVCACRLAKQVGLMNDEALTRVERLVVACGLPIGGVAAEVEAILAVMLTDKKVRGGKVRFVLPVGLGNATVRDDIDPQLVRDVVGSVVAR